MRLIVVVGILLSSGFTIDAQDAVVAVDVDRRLLAIELETYFNAYEDVAATLRKTESELAHRPTYC